MRNVLFLLCVICLIACGNSEDTVGADKKLINNFLNQIVFKDLDAYNRITKEVNSYSERDSLTQEEKAKKAEDLISKAVEDSELNQYFESNLFKENPEAVSMIKFWILGLRASAKAQNWNEQEIFSFEEANDNEIVTKSEMFLNLKTDEKNLYLVMFDKKPDHVIFFIIDNKKITSFFGSGIRKKSSDPLRPYMLN